VRQHPSEPRRRFDSTSPPPVAAAKPARGKRGEFRADIQGLRAIAVLLVLIYHLWPNTLTGGFVGVDVFFVISGFLITAHLLQHPPQRGRDLLEFWGRRIRRLLPAAFLVLAVTAIASLLLAPQTRWAATAGQTIASALYVQNWVLAANSVDYLAAADPPTPVQHYWSLSVEEQFYLFWPILILAIFWLVRRARLAPAVVTRVAMLAVIAASLYVSITATASDPASAYFITPTRVWELAVGGLVFRHEPSPAAQPGEIAGHLHPCATVTRHGQSLRRRAFAADSLRLVMPAFGAYAGGLDVLDDAIAGLFAGAFAAYMLGGRRVYAVAARGIPQLARRKMTEDSQPSVPAMSTANSP